MGSFSWTRADITTSRSNFTYGDKYKILVPEEFGGGYIKDIYCDYGYVFYLQNDEKFKSLKKNINSCNNNNEGYFVYVDGNGVATHFESFADLYGIVAYWNKCENMKYESVAYPKTMVEILTSGNTRYQNNRHKGIYLDIDSVNSDFAQCSCRFKYPLKLVSASYKGTYESCRGRSYRDPNQGFGKYTWNCKDYDEIFSELYSLEPDVEVEFSEVESQSNVSDDVLDSVKSKIIDALAETEAGDKLYHLLSGMVKLIDDVLDS